MIHSFATWLGYAAILLAPVPALACGDPPERWYRDVSDVIFDGNARCDAERRTCTIQVTRVLKNSADVVIPRRNLEVDFQNWYNGWYADHPNEIILICGVPLFEPDQSSFRARFYANVNFQTSELIVRTARTPRQTHRDDE